MFRVDFKNQSVTLTLNLNFRSRDSRPFLIRERDRDGIPERRSDQLTKKKNSERQNANYQI